MKNFKIPKPLIYYGLGINTGMFFFGIALDSWNIAILSIANSIFCLFPLFAEGEEE